MMLWPLNRRRPAVVNDNPAPEPEEAQPQESRPEESKPWEPSLVDVLVTKVMLQRGCRLPAEMVDAIVDAAEYWPHSTATADFVALFGSAKVVTSGHAQTAAAFCLRTPPIGLCRAPSASYTTDRPVLRVLGADERFCPPSAGRHWMPPPPPPPVPSAATAAASPAPAPAAVAAAWPALTNPCRKIVFQLQSRDQGWTSSTHHRDHRYAGAYSWFDVGKERFAEKVPPLEGDNNNNNNAETPLADLPGLHDLLSVDPPVKLASDPASSSSRLPHRRSAPSPSSSPPPPPPPVPVLDLPRVELPSQRRLQSNVVAEHAWSHHTVVWSWADTDPGRVALPLPADAAAAVAAGSSNAANDDTTRTVHALELQGRGAETGDGRFVRELLAGDVVTVWAKSVFPGWQNQIAKATIKVYWAL